MDILCTICLVMYNVHVRKTGKVIVHALCIANVLLCTCTCVPVIHSVWVRVQCGDGDCVCESPSDDGGAH